MLRRRLSPAADGELGNGALEGVQRAHHSSIAVNHLLQRPRDARGERLELVDNVFARLGRLGDLMISEMRWRGGLGGCPIYSLTCGSPQEPRALPRRNLLSIFCCSTTASSIAYSRFLAAPNSSSVGASFGSFRSCPVLPAPCSGMSAMLAGAESRRACALTAGCQLLNILSISSLR